jgi:hypothetical protein
LGWKLPSFIESLDAAGLVSTLYDHAIGWPDALDLERLTRLQSPEDTNLRETLSKLLEDGCRRKDIQSSPAMKWAGLYITHPAHMVSLDKLVETTEREITAPVFFDWLQRADIRPSAYIAAWFATQGIVEPPAAPEVAVVALAGTHQTPDAERRLARLRELGGNAQKRRGEWKFTGMSMLVESERAENRKRRSEKTMRADLIQAATSADEEQRAGFATGLGKL